MCFYINSVATTVLVHTALVPCDSTMHINGQCHLCVVGKAEDTSWKIAVMPTTVEGLTYRFPMVSQFHLGLSGLSLSQLNPKSLHPAVLLGAGITPLLILQWSTILVG